MVRNAADKKDLTKVSYSFIPSLECNNECSFCMYGASPTNKARLGYEDTMRFMLTVKWGKVVGWGLYGGEPSIDLPLYQQFYELLPEKLSKFIITNGAWSTDKILTKTFLDWCAYKFEVIISGTKEHRKYQDVAFLKRLVQGCKGVIYKPVDEEMHPMGRLARDVWKCTRKCNWHEQVMRLGIFPTGDIIMQNCDGVYPVVGHIKTTTFTEAFDEGVRVRMGGCGRRCKNVNDLIGG